jgi:hypothetical protein
VCLSVSRRERLKYVRPDLKFCWADRWTQVRKPLRVRALCAQRCNGVFQNTGSQTAPTRVRHTNRITLH